MRRFLYCFHDLIASGCYLMFLLSNGESSLPRKISQYITLFVCLLSLNISGVAYDPGATNFRYLVARSAKQFKNQRNLKDLSE